MKIVTKPLFCGLNQKEDFSLNNLDSEAYLLHDLGGSNQEKVISMQKGVFYGE